jgi:hypothetical protein
LHPDLFSRKSRNPIRRQEKQRPDQDNHNQQQRSDNTPNPFHAQNPIFVICAILSLALRYLNPTALSLAMPLHYRL